MNDKGFTTIELILAMVIAGVIMGAAGTFLVFNLNAFNSTTDIIDIQYEGQLAINQLTNIMKESTGIELLSDDDMSIPADALSTEGPVTPNSMQLLHTERDPSNASLLMTTEYNITYDENTDTLTLNMVTPSGSETYVMATYVSGFEIKSQTGVAFADTTSVQIYLTLNDNDANLDLQSHVKFRNKR